jgi:hypothetical protein
VAMFEKLPYMNTVCVHHVRRTSICELFDEWSGALSVPIRANQRMRIYNTFDIIDIY